MSSVKVLVLVLLLVSVGHRVEGLLNITEDALAASRKMLGEIEKTHSYSSLAEANDKLKSISEIFFAFCRRRKTAQAGTFVDDTSAVVGRAPDSVKLAALEFHQLSEEVFRDLDVRYALDDLYEDRALSDAFHKYPVNELRVLPAFLYPFVEDNSRHLFRDQSYGDIIGKLHNLPVAVDQNNESVLSFMSNDGTQAKVCPSHLRQSQQQLIFNLIKRIALFDAQVYTTSQYSLAAYKVFFNALDHLRREDKLDLQRTPTLWRDRDVVKRMTQIEFEFVTRNRKTFQSFKDSMASLSRDMWRCDVDEYLNKDEPREGASLVKMRVFQKYVANEIDLNDRKSCMKKCSQYNKTKLYGCYDQGVCAYQTPCNGTLWNCDSQIQSDMQLCLSNGNSKTRYEYIEVKGKKLGQNFVGINNTDSCNNTLVKVQTWHRWLVKCSHCMCTCENSANDDSYFNLRPVTSNMDLNNVVVGVRFQRKNQVMHVQIQQGKLMPNGAIDESSVQWKEMDEYGIADPSVTAGKDFHPISWSERTLCLDSVESPREHRVVTGVRFKKVNGYLKLEIRETEFDFATGKLVAESSQWYSNNDTLRERTEINFEDPNDYETTLTSNRYLRFTTSTLEMDAGQSTVPFINIRSVQSNPPVPLSGVGIFLRSDKHYGNILMLKISTYNVEPHITL
ncbi:uncharacterized protein LOC106641819 [Copidosoma floridanum]|uniref:uncharacterized protein LOC106641819 n=1 Tax=Copidosoma floridanum TaxID=29053 RepID=UPI0006C948B9|nr:uncharacterized protein LOC106641819 [Copidosoma floridanum]XP_014211839.1 uncharacterized protein LOC106641819 [Copidosoma floridanum]